MESLWIEITIGVLVFVIGWSLSRLAMHAELKRNKKSAKEILESATKEAERKKNKIIVKAKEDWYRIRDERENKLKQRYHKLEQLEEKLAEQKKKLSFVEDDLKEKEGVYSKGKRQLESQGQAVKAKSEELDRLLVQQNRVLAKTTNLSIEEAKEQLLQNLRQEFNREAAEVYKQIIDESKSKATREAKRILTMTIERIASEHASETAVSVVPLPSEEIKGRIIGREGRNIKAFEQATGVKVIVDDTPEAVVLSAFDPVRREVARLALEKLITNGKIHPHRVDDVVAACEKEVDSVIWRAGNEAIAAVGIGKIHPEMIRTLGRLYFRTSYGQNVLNHSKEVAFVCGYMAAELRLDVKLAKRAALLHDIGKAISQNREGTHTQLGMEIAEKYNEGPVVINAIGSHHEDIPADNLISLLVSAADAISGSRPGARRDTLDGYVKRIDKLEQVADGFDMVSKAYAISAGREIRVMVQPDRVTDAEADLLASDIAKKIQQELEYPGQIKVTVIRETKSVSYA